VRSRRCSARHAHYGISIARDAERRAGGLRAGYAPESVFVRGPLFGEAKPRAASAGPSGGGADGANSPAPEADLSSGRRAARRKECSTLRTAVARVRKVVGWMRSVEASARRVVAHLMGLESAESTLADRSRPISPICHRALEALPRRRGLLAAERVDRAESGRTSTAIATHEAAATVAARPGPRARHHSPLSGTGALTGKPGTAAFPTV
jgi:hypothetical protein